MIISSILRLWTRNAPAKITLLHLFGVCCFADPTKVAVHCLWFAILTNWLEETIVAAKDGTRPWPHVWAKRYQIKHRFFRRSYGSGSKAFDDSYASADFPCRL